MSLSELIAHFNDCISSAEQFLILSRSSRLQYEQALALDTIVYNIARAKQIAVGNKDEDLANLFLGFECAVGAIRSELMMYLLLKRDDANAAWDRLVAAQMGCLDATRAHRGFSDCAKRLADLQNLEKLLFPQQVFMSAGFLSAQLDCSICGQPTSRCDHLRGRPYMGQLCEFIHREPRGNHVAIVEAPADKRCRVVSVKIKEGHKDRITLEVTAYKEGESYNENDALEVSTIFLALNRFPYMDTAETVLGALTSS